MWNSLSRANLVGGVLLVLVLLPALAVAAAPQTLTGKTVWREQVQLTASVIVPVDAELLIAPGTTIVVTDPNVKITVQGLLQIDGRSARPVIFQTPPGWLGIDFYGRSKVPHVVTYAEFFSAKVALSTIETELLIRNCRFHDCETAVKLLRETKTLIEDCTFTDNNIGVDVEMKSRPTIRHNRFSGHRKAAIIASHGSFGPISGNTFEKNEQAIGLMQKYTDELSNNRFVDNKVGIYCNQTQSTPLITRNYFSGNDNALVNFSFSYPQVEDSTFIANQTAVRNDQFGSPAITNSLFRDNRLAVYNYRKANPTLKKNLFEKNDVVLFCDYSSYPQVKDNHFIRNRQVVELGIFQSADWEKRSGSKGIVMEQAQARRTQNPLLAKAPTEFNDYVDVSGNWWGDDTAQLAAVGDGNSALFFDRHDKPTVTYEGFGPESYVLDIVRFRPWLKKPLAAIGPRGK